MAVFLFNPLPLKHISAIIFPNPFLSFSYGRQRQENTSTQSGRPIVIARELTKMHEEIVNTKVDQLPTVAKSLIKKGEFVVIVGAQ